MDKNGFAHILLAPFLVVLLVVVGVVSLSQSQKNKIAQSALQVMSRCSGSCTQHSLPVCQDGEQVIQDGLDRCGCPNPPVCMVDVSNFDTSDWKIYESDKFKFKFQYPESFNLSETRAVLGNGEEAGNLNIHLNQDDIDQGGMLLGVIPGSKVWYMRYEAKVNDEFMGIPAYIDTEEKNPEFAQSIHFLSPYDDSLFRISYGHGPAANVPLFRQILSTFEFTNN